MFLFELLLLSRSVGDKGRSLFFYFLVLVLDMVCLDLGEMYFRLLVVLVVV